MAIKLNFAELIPGRPQKVSVGEKEVCVVRIADEVFAVADTCSHADASLSEGEVSGTKIECWLHGAEFDLRTGEALTLPANIPAKTYPVKIVNDVVEIQVN